MRKFALLALIVCGIAEPAFSDSVKGTIIAFYQSKGVIVLDDKTVWPLGDAVNALPDDLTSGDSVEIVFISAGENALAAVNSVVRTTQQRRGEPCFRRLMRTGDRAGPGNKKAPAQQGPSGFYIVEAFPTYIGMLPAS